MYLILMETFSNNMDGVAPNQEINGMNAIKAFPQINAEYAFGIRPNQRQMRVWHLAGMNAVWHSRRARPTIT